ncbi:amino acid permease [Pedobacter sp. MC2016-14]|uniref:APC family permease n=1 Tax=Pedobacter sp. MC2016-14 TaxID=2897327 RepID=UPI001E3939A7|nr:amino acid permease [Pedobacter sp. MC2016-14]MCD0489126.1 amino acid permease [Pedobacter sp. MC2016-14]
MTEIPNGKNSLKREIGLLDAIFLVVGSMIGSGIFIVGADITRHTGSPFWFIAVWVIGGVMTLIAALSYGELSAMFPRAGGQYIYLKEAYNPLVAFVYGWSLFAVIQTGTIAAVGVSFSKFLAYFVPGLSEDLVLFNIGSLSVSPAQGFAILLLVFITYINTKGVKGGKIIQSIFTATKILSIAGLIIFGFIHLKTEVWHANWSNWKFQSLSKSGVFTNYPSFPALAGALASALVGAIMSYEAWNNVTFVAGEIRDPKRNIGRSLLIGTVLVTLIYVLLNLMFTAVLPLHEIAATEKDRVGLAASQVIFGIDGTIVIAILIMIATFGCNNGLILAGARVYYSMAKDGLFFNKVAQLNKHAVPAFALWLQCLVASLLCLSGKYGDLLDMITFIAVLFYVLTILAVFLLRVRRPAAERPYKAIGYPFLPALYILMGSSFCILLIIYKPGFTWPGLIIATIGIPLFYINEAFKKKSKSV